MTAHELAKKLLEGPNLPVSVATKGDNWHRVQSDEDRPITVAVDNGRLLIEGQTSATFTFGDEEEESFVVDERD